LPQGYLEDLRAAFAQGGRAALVGIPLGSFEDGYTNSAIALQPGAARYQYHKHHLVPFGEFIPPLFKWFTRMMNIPLGDFNRGDVGQASLAWQGQRLAPNICYEDLFGEELGARFADRANAPTIFVNLSNIAWFGNSIAIDQHLQISRLRALEFDRPMIRATNTGATAIIDRFGRVTHALPRHTRGVLVGEVEGGTAFTPYARWVSAWGLWPLWAIAFGAVVAAVFAARRRSQP
jgi:apolipoprotein N-acyltransferase